MEKEKGLTKFQFNDKEQLLVLEAIASTQAAIYQKLLEIEETAEQYRHVKEKKKNLELAKVRIAAKMLKMKMIEELVLSAQFNGRCVDICGQDLKMILSLLQIVDHEYKYVLIRRIEKVLALCQKESA